MKLPDSTFPDKYQTSGLEIKRRKTAFTTFSISLFTSVYILIYILFSTPISYYLLSMGVLGLLLFISVLFFNRFLNLSKEVIITISDQTIERKGLNKNDICNINSIKNMRIKRTISNKIREIKIIRTGSYHLYINGIEKIEILKDHILNNTGNKIDINEIKEPVDFDHPLFYVFLGLFLGIVSIFIFKWLLFIKPVYFKYIQILIICYLFFVSIYLYMSKPISGRYGKKKIVPENVLSIALILAGIALFVINNFL